MKKFKNKKDIKELISRVEQAVNELESGGGEDDT
jgi:hypothetical protein